MHANQFRESLRSPVKSPKKSRPQTGLTKVNSSLNQSAMNDAFRYKYLNEGSYNIIREVTGQDILAQDKDIEIERLKTTCQNLNNKAAISDDLRSENEILKRRLEESERARANLEHENS